MIGNLIVLLGIGFFLKVFFDTAANMRLSDENKDTAAFKKSATIHILLGVIFVFVGRLIVALT
ncbi:hypothetical protein [Aerococcus loyolae]|uniref:DUF1146 domain-containing protein n=1 Tax=Aerococcus loyolae TaxID=2976809 RepID=A0ABT4BYD9_9LACT|nr:hypothetical protein [Aerococcus loyolae]MCY3025282.1 hypothetical protein [Aerococcus loyolae]MCY3027804.1 hypothetical protein [Aerococcus loyolae]MCY3029181.1 hypothetical protein [Aerococcus loyolae]